MKYYASEEGERHQITLAIGTPFTMVTEHRRQMRETLGKS